MIEKALRLTCHAENPATENLLLALASPVFMLCRGNRGLAPLIPGSVAFGCLGQLAGMLCLANVNEDRKTGVVTFFSFVFPAVNSFTEELLNGLCWSRSAQAMASMVLYIR